MTDLAWVASEIASIAQATKHLYIKGPYSLTSFVMTRSGAFHSVVTKAENRSYKYDEFKSINNIATSRSRFYVKLYYIKLFYMEK